MFQGGPKKRKVVFSWIFLLLIMLLIFLLSSQSTVETQQLSKTMSEKILAIQNRIFSETGYYRYDVEEINWKLRKLAHFTLFLMLGIATSSILARRWSDSRNWILPALLICILYAAGDEFHQMFVMGRTASIQDVILDTGGAITGIAWYLWKRGRRDEGKI